MKLSIEQIPPVDRADFQAFLVSMLRQIIQQVNLVTEGRVFALHTAVSAAPTAGNFTVGDFVPNTGRGVELGAIGSKYTLQGWVCSAESPLTFLEVRCPTGN